MTENVFIIDFNADIFRPKLAVLGACRKSIIPIPDERKVKGVFYFLDFKGCIIRKKMRNQILCL